VGFTVARFDTGAFMNTYETGNLILTILSLTVMLLLTNVIVGQINPRQAASKRKKRKTAGMLFRPVQKGR